jgi:hypothetical protein
MNNQPMDPDNVFYDILISNALSTNTEPPIVTFIDTRSIPLINNTSDFQLSIIRFYLDTQTLPVFCATIQPNQTDINLSVYSITLSYTSPSTNITYTFQKYLEFIPQDLSAVLPKPPNQNGPYYFQDNSTGYYYVYDYQYLITLVNNTFQQAIVGLNNLLTQANVTLITDIAPNMTFNVSSLVGTINYDSDNYGTNETGKINMYINQSMYELFSSFSTIINGYTVSQGKNFQLQLFSSGNTTQEYSTVGSWNPVVSIVFSSGSLPIISNQISLPHIYYNGKIINNSSTANIFNVITDLVATDNNYKPYILYTPSGEYRFLSLHPNQAIRHIDISIFWQNSFGEYIPVRLSTNGTCSMKLLFSKIV